MDEGDWATKQRKRTQGRRWPWPPKCRSHLWAETHQPGAPGSWQGLADTGKPGKSNMAGPWKVFCWLRVGDWHWGCLGILNRGLRKVGRGVHKSPTCTLSPWSLSHIPEWEQAAVDCALALGDRVLAAQSVTASVSTGSLPHSHERKQRVRAVGNISVPGPACQSRDIHRGACAQTAPGVGANGRRVSVCMGAGLESQPTVFHLTRGEGSLV